MKLFLDEKLLCVAITVIMTPALSLLCMEMILRVYFHFRFGVPGKRYGIYMSDKELGAVHRPNSYNHNSVMNNWGFRNTADICEQKPAGATRIYCSGHSTTFCYNLNTEEAWPSILQNKLREIPGHAHDEVLNTGEISFATAHEFTLAKRFIPRLKPDIVILNGTGMNEGLAEGLLKKEGNDLDLMLAQKEWGIYPRNLDQARFLKRTSALFRFYEYIIRGYFKNKSAGSRQENIVLKPHEWVVENFAITLRAYLSFLHDNNCRIIIVRHGDNDVENEYLIKYIRYFREKAIAIGREKGVMICDFLAVVDNYPNKRELYAPGGVHVTKRGAELFADTILKTIITELR